MASINWNEVKDRNEYVIINPNADGFFGIYRIVDIHDGDCFIVGTESGQNVGWKSFDWMDKHARLY